MLEIEVAELGRRVCMCHDSSLVCHSITRELWAVHQLLQHEGAFAADVDRLQEGIQAGWLAWHDEHGCSDRWIIKDALQDESADQTLQISPNIQRSLSEPNKYSMQPTVDMNFKKGKDILD